MDDLFKCDCGSTVALFIIEDHCQCAACMWAELERLQGIVDKLPKYADTGQPIAPGMNVWRWDESHNCPKQCYVKFVGHNAAGLLFHGIDDGSFKGCDLYSTKAAAEAAKDKEPANG